MTEPQPVRFMDRPRCRWPGSDAQYIRYHDEEWGRPVADDIRLFEKISLEGFQAGLSWLTILRKRDNFRAAFAGFDPVRVAAFSAADIDRLVEDKGIIRHRGKIASVVNNAARVLDVQKEFGSLARFLWRYEPKEDDPAFTPRSTSPEAVALSKDLRRRGFSFVGPTTVYALMQAMGMVNDHGEECFCRAECHAARLKFIRP